MTLEEEEVSEGKKNFVHHDIAKSQFFIILDHGITAYIKYEVLPHNGIHFLTTQVPESHKGQGLAKILVKDALNFWHQKIILKETSKMIKFIEK